VEGRIKNPAFFSLGGLSFHFCAGLNSKLVAQSFAALGFYSATPSSSATGLPKNMNIESRRFVTSTEKVEHKSPWALEEWLCRSDVVPNRDLLMVRVNIEPGRGHAFHTHPNREEIIYVLSGKAEQWVGREHRILKPGDMALILKGEVHATYNPFDEMLVVLAILAPAGAAEPALVDVSKEEPWASMRKGMPVCV